MCATFESASPIPAAASRPRVASHGTSGSPPRRPPGLRASEWFRVHFGACPCAFNTQVSPACLDVPHLGPDGVPEDVRLGAEGLAGRVRSRHRSGRPEPDAPKRALHGRSSSWFARHGSPSLRQPVSSAAMMSRCRCGPACASSQSSSRAPGAEPKPRGSLTWACYRIRRAVALNTTGRAIRA